MSISKELPTQFYGELSGNAPTTAGTAGAGGIDGPSKTAQIRKLGAILAHFWPPWLPHPPMDLE